MTWSGVCLRAIVSVIPPVSIVGHEYSQSHWTTFRGPNHADISIGAVQQIVLDEGIPLYEMPRTEIATA